MGAGDGALVTALIFGKAVGSSPTPVGRSSEHDHPLVGLLVRSPTPGEWSSEQDHPLVGWSVGPLSHSRWSVIRRPSPTPSPSFSLLPLSSVGHPKTITFSVKHELASARAY